MTNASSMHETGHSKLMHWDNPKEWDREGGGRGVQDGGHMYIHGWYISVYGKNHYNIVVVFAIHWDESAMGVHVSPILNPPSHLPPHPIPLGCSRASALGALCHDSHLRWSAISHMAVCYVSMLFSHSVLSFLPLSPKVCSLHLSSIYMKYKNRHS